MSVETYAPSSSPPAKTTDNNSLNIPSHGVRNPRISLRQWRVLQAVVDCGGFAQASGFLHLSQSAISYALAKLQEQLGVPILEIKGRKAQLTEMGHAMVERSRHLIQQANEIEAFACAMEQGWEPEIRLAINSTFPPGLLMHALKMFTRTGKGTQVVLNDMPCVGIGKALQQGKVDLAISAQVPMGFLGNPLMEVEYVAVVCPGHPLLSLGKAVTAADLERVKQIVIRDFESPEKRNGIGQRLYQGPRWDVAHFDMAVAAVREGLGFAWLLKHRIQELLSQGALVPLPLLGGNINKVTLHLIYGITISSNPGPAVSHLIDVLHNVTAGERPNPYSAAA